MLSPVISSVTSVLTRTVPFSPGGSGGGGGGGVDADAQAVIDAMTTTPSAARQTSIDSFVKDLKTGPTNGTDVWSELDALWVLAAADSQAALLNWMDPTGTAATAVSSPTFTADKGYAGTGSAYINTNWNATDDGVNASQDSISVGVLVGSIGASGDAFIGGYGNASALGRTALYNLSGSMRAIGPTTNSGSANIATLAAGDFFAVDRSSSTVRVGYKNGGSIALPDQASTGNLDGDLYILAENNNGPASLYQQSSGSVKVAFAGGSMTANQHADLHAAINNYLTAISTDWITGATDSDAIAILTEMTTRPIEARQTKIDTLVKELKSGPTNGTDVWSELDALWVLQAADEQAALLNWKDPSGTAATAVNSPTFTADLGYTGTNSSHIETNWNPATDGVNFTQNSSSLGCWVHQLPGTFDGVMGARESATGHISEIYHGSNVWDFCGSTTNGSGATWLQGPSTATTGLVAADRDGASSMTLYEGGSSTDTSTTASSAIWSGTFHLLGIREGGSAAYRGTAGLSMAFVSGSLTANKHADLYAAINNYRTGL